MPLINSIKHIFLKRSIRILHLSRRNLMLKNKSSWKDTLQILETDINRNFKKIQDSKLTPKGFEVIYVTPLLSWLKWTYAALPFFWGILCYDAYVFFKDPGKYKLKLEERRLQLSYKDKIFQLALFMSFIVILHLGAGRSVMATFRKENEFQTLLYGVLGPLTKKYVPHGFQAMKQTITPSLYDLKGKKVFVWSNGFRTFKDFSSVVAFKAS